jgi:Fe2+ or Zn2+ uptake regulation protein
VESEHPLIMTEQRRVILDELRKVHTHPTADEVYEFVRRRLPNISLGTVYRNLETLSAAGMIQKLEMAGSQKRFDGKVDSHYHVRCMSCGRVDDVDVGRIPGIDEAMKAVRGYQVLSHKLEFLGVCRPCREKRAMRHQD